MGDLNEPQQPIRWRTMGVLGARWRMPLPPGPPPELSKAQRLKEERAEERAEARAARSHLGGLLSGGMILMGVVLAVVVVMFVVVLASQH